MSVPVDPSADEAKVTRLLGEWAAFADGLRARRPATAAVCDDLAGALAEVLGSADDPVSVDGWFDVGREDGRLRVRMADVASRRVYGAFALVDDAQELRAAVRLCLDSGTQLQQVRGGNAAAGAMVDTAATMVPVLEAVGNGLHPVVGATATILRHQGERLVDSADAGRMIDGWLSGMDGEELAAAVRGLIALAETLVADPEAVEAGKMILTAAVRAAGPIVEGANR